METTLFSTPALPQPALDTLQLDRVMQRYAGGDSAVFPQLFGLLEPRLRRQLRTLCRSEELARELTQETFLRIHRARRSFGHGRAALPWAHAIARNCYKSHARSWGSRLSRASVDADQCELPAESHDSETSAIAGQTRELLHGAIARLPAAQQHVVWLRAQGLSLGAVAERLGVSEGAVKLRSFRTFRVLRRALRRAGGAARR